MEIVPLALPRFHTAIDLVCNEIASNYFLGEEKSRLLREAVVAGLEWLQCEAMISDGLACVHVAYTSVDNHLANTLRCLLVEKGQAGFFSIERFQPEQASAIINHLRQDRWIPSTDSSLRRNFDNGSAKVPHVIEVAALCRQAVSFPGSLVQDFQHQLCWDIDDWDPRVEKWEQTIQQALGQDIENLFAQAAERVDPALGYLVMKTKVPKAYEWAHASRGTQYRVKALNAWQGIACALMINSLDTSLDDFHRSPDLAGNLSFPYQMSRRIDNGEDPLVVAAETLGVSLDFMINGMPRVVARHPVYELKFLRLCGSLIEKAPEECWPSDVQSKRYWRETLGFVRQDIAKNYPNNEIPDEDWADYARQIDPCYFTLEIVRARDWHLYPPLIQKSVNKTEFFTNVGAYLLLPILSTQLDEYGLPALAESAIPRLTYQLGRALYRAEGYTSVEACERVWTEASPQESIHEYQTWQLSESVSLGGDRDAISRFGYDPGHPETLADILDLYRPCLPADLQKVKLVTTLLDSAAVWDVCQRHGIDLPLPETLAKNLHEVLVKRLPDMAEPQPGST